MVSPRPLSGGGFLEEHSCVYVRYFLGHSILRCRSVFGQGTDLGTIRGTVTDSTGAVIPGAMVTVTDALTKTARETRTNSRGIYEMFGLQPGTYRVVITAAGMSKEEITDVVLNGSDVVSADAALKVSAAQESVVVSMEAPAINTEDQTISQTLNNQAIVELPRDSRNVYNLSLSESERNPGRRRRQFQIIGAQSYGASFSLDGQRSNGGILACLPQASLRWRVSARLIF